MKLNTVNDILLLNTAQSVLVVRHIAPTNVPEAISLLTFYAMASQASPRTEPLPGEEINILVSEFCRRFLNGDGSIDWAVVEDTRIHVQQMAKAMRQAGVHHAAI